MTENYIDIINNNIKGAIYTGEPLSNHTTYKVGGEAECLVCPDSTEEARWIYEYAKRESIPLTLLGTGSNVIAPDRGIRGIVLKLRTGSARVQFPEDNRIVADAGVTLIDLAKKAAAKGLKGFESIAGIPGTVGGAVFMNAGTKDGDTASLLEKVEVITGCGRKRIFYKEELSFGYRKSAFQKTDWLILRVHFKLERGVPERIRKGIEKIYRERQRKFPLDFPNAGSVFKRPPGDYAGRLIEEAGCKGMSVGGASVSKTHANFIINSDNATSEDIIGLISEIRRIVYDKYGIYLELEQKIFESFR
ncbi:MAG: UDP-N-acetylmuramate dehydrogenase [Candidatus Krumholzibacteriota bacterium]|nr:UDP-N-acetylmuramate dehydrogenase [Candidatus Krumholzibacteriota bacterium]